MWCQFRETNWTQAAAEKMPMEVKKMMLVSCWQLSAESTLVMRWIKSVVYHTSPVLVPSSNNFFLSCLVIESVAVRQSSLWKKPLDIWSQQSACLPQVYHQLMSTNLQCVSIKLISSNFNVWQRRVSEEVYDGVLLHFLEEEEEPHPVPDHAVLQARPARLPLLHDYHFYMAIMNKSKEREKPRWTRQIQPVASACISVHLYLIVMMPNQIVYFRYLLYRINHFTFNIHHEHI